MLVRDVRRPSRGVDGLLDVGGSTARILALVVPGSSLLELCWPATLGLSATSRKALTDCRVGVLGAPTRISMVCQRHGSVPPGGDTWTLLCAPAAQSKRMAFRVSPVPIAVRWCALRLAAHPNGPPLDKAGERQRYLTSELQIPRANGVVWPTPMGPGAAVSGQQLGTERGQLGMSTTVAPRRG